MAQLVLVALTALAAVAGYWGAARFASERGRAFIGVPTKGWGVACGLAGLLGAVFVPAFVVGLLAGVVGYNEARKLQDTWREAPFDISVPVWVVICAVFGFGGAVLVPPAVWLVVCAWLALVGALLLVIEERNVLDDEKRVLLAENRRLLAEKNVKPPIERPGAPPNAVGSQASGTDAFGTRKVSDPSNSGWSGSSLQHSMADPQQSAGNRQRARRGTNTP
jgi:hypothetical protein